jgi:diadenylate cyclase
MEHIFDFIGSYWRAAFEILLLAAAIYYLLMLVRGTRGAAVLTGFLILLLGVAGVTQIFKLDVINWILGRILAFMAIAVLVIFQPELRRALAQLGSRYPFSSPRLRFELIDVLVETARSLSQKRCGGLMAVEREIGFRGVAETGVAVDSKATPELLTTIFFPNTPLHDGGVVLRGDRIVSAACVFPLTQRQGLSASVGMRHRAAIGLTEETDAVVVVVSEETGDISVAHRGHLVQGLDPDGLRDFLTTTLAPSAKKGTGMGDFLRRTVSSLFLREARGGVHENFSSPTEPLDEASDMGGAEPIDQDRQHKEAGH